MRRCPPGFVPLRVLAFWCEAFPIGREDSGKRWISSPFRRVCRTRASPWRTGLSLPSSGAGRNCREPCWRCSVPHRTDPARSLEWISGISLRVIHSLSGPVPAGIRWETGNRFLLAKYVERSSRCAPISGEFYDALEHFFRMKYWMRNESRCSDFPTGIRIILSR